MLVVISDLHFIDSTAGKHNVATEAFEDVFLTWLPELAKDKRADELKVLLLGDIVDLIRTEKWLEDNFDLSDRPWGENGIKDINDAVARINRAGDESPGTENGTRSKTEERCLEILGEIEHIDEEGDDYRETVLSRNREAFRVFRDDERGIKAKMRKAGIGFELIYLPGNHDRLCNLYPKVRDRLKDALGLTMGTEGKDWWYPHHFEDEDYGVYARHGHDVWNYGNMNNYHWLDDYERAGQLQVSIGDVIATEFAVKLPWMVEKMREDKAPGATEDLVSRLREVDNVRPVGNVIEWLLYRIRDERGEARDALEEATSRVLDELFEIPLVEEWSDSETYADEVVHFVNGPLRYLLRNHHRGLLGSLESRLASSLYQTLSGWKARLADPERDNHTEAARTEPAWENGNIHYLLYGHTHNPLIHPLHVSDGGARTYINTGTWRERIVKTVSSGDVPPQFVSLNQVTYVVFYKAEERGIPSFDMWTGSSEAKGYG